MALHHRSRIRQRGNAIIEFGVTFPLLFVLLIGMFQFGYAFFLYNQLQSVVRSGARYASATDFDSDGNGAAFTTNVANVVVFGSPSGGITPLVSGLRTAAVSVTWQADAANVPQTVTVRISSFTMNLLGQSFQLTNKPYSTFIYLGQFLDDD